MEKENKKEEIQSRREFFKNAAKATLPMIAVVALVSAPAIVNAAEAAPMGCSSGCYTECSSTCKGTCLGKCNDYCFGCGTACSKGCSSTCTGGCKGTCRIR